MAEYGVGEQGDCMANHVYKEAAVLEMSKTVYWMSGWCKLVWHLFLPLFHDSWPDLKSAHLFSNYTNVNRPCLKWSSWPDASINDMQSCRGAFFLL